MRLAKFFLLLAALLVVSSAQAQKIWAAPDWAWAKAKEQGGAHFTLSTGAHHQLSAPTLDLLVDMKARLTKASGFDHVLAISEYDAPNAFAIPDFQGSPTVALTLALLRALDGESDALAAVYAHELAHLVYKHGGHQEREKRVQTEGSGFLLEQEREADKLGLQWSVAAGFNPCGLIVVNQRATLPGERKWHPSLKEREDLANAAAKQQGRECSTYGR